jgi:hypothetical protein
MTSPRCFHTYSPNEAFGVACKSWYKRSVGPFDGLSRKVLLTRRIYNMLYISDLRSVVELSRMRVMKALRWITQAKLALSELNLALRLFGLYPDSCHTLAMQHAQTSNCVPQYSRLSQTNRPPAASNHRDDDDPYDNRHKSLGTYLLPDQNGTDNLEFSTNLTILQSRNGPS